jgi:hypothetical protein
MRIKISLSCCYVVCSTINKYRAEHLLWIQRWAHTPLEYCICPDAEGRVSIV